MIFSIFAQFSLIIENWEIFEFFIINVHQFLINISLFSLIFLSLQVWKVLNFTYFSSLTCQALQQRPQVRRKRGRLNEGEEVSDFKEEKQVVYCLFAVSKEFREGWREGIIFFFFLVPKENFFSYLNLIWNEEVICKKNMRKLLIFPIIFHHFSPSTLSISINSLSLMLHYIPKYALHFGVKSLFSHLRWGNKNF